MTLGNFGERAVAVLCLAMLALPARAATLVNFDNLAVGTALSNQIPGVSFTPNAFSGPGSPNGNWATNTNLTIVSAAGSDVSGLGLPSLVSGNLVRSFNGWLGENGDPSFRISFATPVRSMSLDFAGVAQSRADSTRIFAFDGTAPLGVVGFSGSTTGQFTLAFTANRITSVVVTPGEFNDWVGVDNLRYTTVPEPAGWAMLLAGFGLAGAIARRRRSAIA